MWTWTRRMSKVLYLSIQFMTVVQSAAACVKSRRMSVACKEFTIKR